MANNKIRQAILASGFAAGALAGSTAYAIDFNITGFVRQEVAFGMTSDDNPFNQMGNPFQGKTVENINSIRTNRQGLNPGDPGFYALTGTRTGKGMPYDNGGWTPARGVPNLTVANGAAGVDPKTAQYVGAYTGNMAGAAAGCVAAGTCGRTAARAKDDNPFNLFATRAEIDIQTTWTEQLKSYVKIRAFSDYQEVFTDGQVDSHFNGDFGWNGRGNLLEHNSPNFMLDLPSAYVDYNSGPFWIRVGQQQIAWGEAYFFRVYDVVNGLDTRRHFTLDVAAEEFSDKRVSSPGIRGSYTFTNGWEVDAFVQMAAPTTIVGTNTPYNVVASGFTWKDDGSEDRLHSNVNYGARVKIPVNDKLTTGVMAVSRLNPDGIVTWSDAPTQLKSMGNVANPFCFGPNNYAGRVLESFGLRALGGGLDTNQDGRNDVDELLTPLGNGKCGANASPDPMGTASWAEWFTMAGKSRLNPVEGVLGFLNGGAENSSGTNASTLTSAAFTAINAFDLGEPTQILNRVGGKTYNSKGAGVSTKLPYTYNAARNTLDAFFNGFAFPRGYITRHFMREEIVGANANYIVESEPGTWLDQLIIRAELSVTPNKKFTPLDLREGTWIEATEVSSALILEKYHSIFEAIPATYLVLQWMHKTESDLFGRHLSGNDHAFKDDLACLPTATSGLANDRNGSTLQPVRGTTSGSQVKGCGRPKGQDGADYVAFAFQQPFPNLIWRADFAMLIDVQGGVLFQPGVRYRPSSKWQFDMYANVIADFTPGRNDDVLETLDWADEAFVRVSYFF